MLTVGGGRNPPPAAHDLQMFHTFPGSVVRPHRLHVPASPLEGREVLCRCEGTIRGTWLAPEHGSIERALVDVGGSYGSANEAQQATCTRRKHVETNNQGSQYR